jgi:hypothetical protein
MGVSRQQVTRVGQRQTLARRREKMKEDMPEVCRKKPPICLNRVFFGGRRSASFGV